MNKKSSMSNYHISIDTFNAYINSSSSSHIEHFDNYVQSDSEAEIETYSYLDLVDTKDETSISAITLGKD